MQAPGGDATLLFTSLFAGQLNKPGVTVKVEAKLSLRQQQKIFSPSEEFNPVASFML